MRVFCDFHHEELYESLRILIEDRLGWEMYRAIGLDWWKEGYWKVYDHPATAEQYLGFYVGEAFKGMQEGEPHTHTFRNVNIDIDGKGTDGLYSIGSAVYPDIRYKAITLDRMKDFGFDLFISSMPQHIEPFNKLIQLYHPKAKHVFQIGNNWPATYPVNNILTSSRMANWGNKHGLFYHQEFDTKLFSPSPPIYSQSIYNLMHYIQNGPDFELVEKFLGPDWTCRIFGAGNRDGSRGPGIRDIAYAYKEMAFLWHTKREGDGYGYNIHHAAAAGRPIITRLSNYRGMTAESLLVDGVTCIDLDRHRPPEVVQMIGKMLINYPEVSQRISDNFKKNVDFDKEFEEIKVFLQNLV